MTDEEIVGYIEKNLAIDEMERMRRHLHACLRCFEAYQESVLLRGMWTTDESVFEPPEDLLDIGRRLAAGGRERKEEVPRGARVRPGLWSGRRLAMAAACAAALLIAAIWLLRPGDVTRVGDAVLNPAILSPVRNAVETASMRGSFVLPGGERFLGTADSAFRSGFVTLSDSLESSLRYLHRAFRSGEATPDAAYWLIGGYVATGQIDAARDLISHPHVAKLRDSRIRILKAIVAYMDGKHDRAEALLRDFLVENPNHPVASINLAVILLEQGNEIESRAILDRIERDHAGTPLAKRAWSILSNYQEE